MSELYSEELVFDNENLPKGWTRTTVGMIYRIIGGGTPPTKVENYWQGNIPWITSADIHGLYDIRPRRYITNNAVKNSTTNLVPEDSIIVVTRVGLGKIAFTKSPICFSQDSQALLGNKLIVYSHYALYFLSQVIQIFKHVNRGTTISGVTKKQLSELPFSLPPLNEQKRIVSKIESILSQIDAVKEKLDKIRVLLKQNKQSVLGSAFEGRLVPQDPNDEPAEVLLKKIHGDSKGLVFDNENLPSGWVRTDIGNTCNILDSKRIPVNSQERQKRVGNIPYYGATGQVGWINDHIFNEELVLLGEDGAPFFDDFKNKAYIIDGKSWVNNHAHVLKSIVGLMSNKFLLYSLNQIDYHKYVRGTTRLKLNQTSMKTIQISLPPLNEQKRIVSKIESILGRIDAIFIKIKLNSLIQDYIIM